MAYGILTERTVAKRRSKPAGEAPQKHEEPAFDRIEIQAPPSWVRLVDTAAAALGMSRSAYIRMATTRQMDADRKAREG